MAVQKKHTTRSKRGMRRAHDSLTPMKLSEDVTTGEKHIRHHITATGFYKGKKVLDIANDSDEG